MGLINKLGEQILQGALGNLSEVDVASLETEFGQYLMDDEKIQVGFKLIRDTMLITDKRIIEFDFQGSTGQKKKIESIFLDSVFEVTAETAGFGLDDSELTIGYIGTPYMKGNGVQYKSKKFEFPKKYNIQNLYKMLQTIAYENYTKLNK